MLWVCISIVFQFSSRTNRLASTKLKVKRVVNTRFNLDYDHPTRRINCKHLQLRNYNNNIFVNYTFVVVEFCSVGVSIRLLTIENGVLWSMPQFIHAFQVWIVKISRPKSVCCCHFLYCICSFLFPVLIDQHKKTTFEHQI